MASAIAAALVVAPSAIAAAPVVAASAIAAAPVVAAAAFAQEPDAAPDLRIVRIEVTPSPLRDGGSATLTIMVHNDSPVVAAGSLAVEVTHDRGTPLPLPLHREVFYLRPDALAEVSFDVSGVTVGASPYTFFATVDALNEVREADEANNTTWERVDVCEGPEAMEVADGLDNDCDGMTDEGLGLPADPGYALRMLRGLQRRAGLDSVLLIYATPRLFAPHPIEHEVLLASEDGDFVGLPQKPGSEPSATFTADAEAARLVLVDWNGDDLESGDLVSLSARGETLVAEGGGSGRLVARPRFRERERLFSLVRLGSTAGESAGANARAGGPVRSGDVVALRASTGPFLSAEQGGGGPLRVDRGSIGGWESFTITLQESRQDR